MRQKSGKNFGKRLLKWVAVLLLLLLLIIATYPLWLPWVARPIANRYGVTWTDLERKGYSEVVFKGLVYTNKNLSVTAGTVNTYSPTIWASRLRKKDASHTFASVRDWVVTIQPKAAPGGQAVDPANTGTGARSQKPPKDLIAVVARLQRLVPSAALTNGTVLGNGFELKVPWLTLHPDALNGMVSYPAQTNLVAQFSAQTSHLPYRLHVTNEFYAIGLNSTFQTNATGYLAEGHLLVETNSAAFKAQLPASFGVPEYGSISTTNLHLPRYVFALPGFEEPAIDLKGTWEKGLFEMQLSGSIRPLRAEDGSPLSFQLNVHGSTNYFVLSRARLESDWFKAALAREVQVVPHSPWILDPAQLYADADLGRQKALQLGGKFNLNLFVAPSAGKYPTARFFARGEDLSHKKWQLTNVDTEGAFDWPVLRLDRLITEVWPASTLEIKGSLNVSNRFLDSATFNVVSSQAPAALTNTLHWSTLIVSGSAHGSLQHIEHQGRIVSSNLSVKATALDNVELGWKGQAANFGSVQASIVKKETALNLEGGLSILTNGVSALLRTLVISNSYDTLLALSAPATIQSLRPRGATNWNTRVEGLKLAGSSGQLGISADVQWPEKGRVLLSGGNISPIIARDFVPGTATDVYVRTVQAWAAWTNGPVKFELATVVEGVRTNLPFTLEARLGGDGQRAQIGYAALVQSNSPIVIVSGSVPISLTPGSAKPFHFDFAGPLRLHAVAQPHPFLLEQLKSLTGWQIGDPELLMDVAGTWNQPKGSVQFNASKVIPKGAGDKTPTIGRISMIVEAEREKLWLRKLEARVQDQPVSVTGEVPLLQRRAGTSMVSLLDWTNASGTVVIDRGAVAAWRPLAPNILGPEGEFYVDLSLQPGPRLFGSIGVSGARTENISTLGAIRDIGLQLVFSNQVAILKSGRARIGGAPIQLAGRADLGLANGVGVPPFTIKATGTSVPLSRQPDTIIRADVDVVVAKTNGSAPLISGDVRMKDSFLLTDLAALVPGRIANPRERPPYFSIDDPPLASMRLKLAVSGPRGMRVRTPYFAGEVSPNLQLMGTLMAPIAVGDVRVDSGLVRFPFGSLQVQQGLVSTTQIDPAHPQVSLSAAARQYGYDIRLDVSGTATTPILQFSSTPPLSSDQILMMLTAGELPRGKFSLTPAQRAQTFAVFLGRDLMAKLGMGDTAGDRFIVRSGQEVSEEGKPTYDIEFKLDNRWSITGEYDRFGDYNAGLKWRVYSK